MPTKIGSHIPKLKKFTGKNLHDLQKYVLSLPASQLNLLAMLADDDDFVYCPQYDLDQVHISLLKTLNGHCNSNVQLAQFIRTSGLAKSFSKAFNAIVNAKSRWMLTNVGDAIALTDRSRPAPEHESGLNG